MGLLDYMNQDVSQGLMAAGAQILQGAGDPRRPYGLGQAMGTGMEAYQDSTEKARRRKLQEEEAAQAKQMREMQMKGMQADIDADQQKAQYSQSLRDFNRDYFAQGTQSPTASALAKMKGPTIENAASLEQMQAQAPMPNRYQDGLRYADAARAAGFSAEADAATKQALQFQPEVKNWEKVKIGGRVLLKPYFKDGTDGAPVAEDVAREMEFRNIGGKTVGFDPYIGTVGASIDNTRSPDNIASVDAQYANAEATREIAGATRDAARIQRDQQTEMKMGDDYRTQSKGFKEVSDAYRTINATLDKATRSPAATLAGATKFMKLLDPGSVVRESELGMALAASGVFDRAMNYHQTLLNGRVLTPTQVKDFKSITGQIYQAAQQSQQAIDQNYKRQAEAYGLRPEMVVQDLGQNSKPSTPEAQQKIAPPQAAINHLRMNPKLRAEFDAKFGAGAAAQYLKGQ